MNTNANILVVEDDEDILELIAYNLEKEHYTVIRAETGESALQAIARKEVSLVLLDLMLPEIDGLEICKRLKSDEATKHIPIIMVTAKGEESDVVIGLELGADDYIPKPFRPRELVARVRTVLRRSSSPSSQEKKDIITYDDMEIHIGKREVMVKGKITPLSYTEFEVLATLAQRPGWVFTRYQIVDSIRGDDYPVTDRSVDVQIVGLRKKLGNASYLIETVRGIGYRFKNRVDE